MSSLSVRAAARSSLRTVVARTGLALVALGNAEVGIWGLTAPRSFYNSFPGFGRHWVSALGPYNEHLIRDYAAAELGFAVLLAITAWWWGRRLVLASGAAFLAATLPHFGYHLSTTGSFGTADNLASLGAFALEIVAVAFAMWVVTQEPEPKEP
jgi:hypothetical protein